MQPKLRHVAWLIIAQEPKLPGAGCKRTLLGRREPIQALVTSQVRVRCVGAGGAGHGVWSGAATVELPPEAAEQLPERPPGGDAAALALAAATRGSGPEANAHHGDATAKKRRASVSKRVSKGGRPPASWP